MSKSKKIGYHGRITRNEGTTFTVEVLGDTHAEEVPDVTCVNIGAPAAERLYRKIFRKKKIYLSHEYDRAKAEHLGGSNLMVLSMNGYSRITPEQCVRYGVKPGAYEAACEAVLRQTLMHLRQTFRAAQLKLIDGASDMGVDRAIATVARDLGMVTLGFSCPRYMLYVPDDERAVFVADNSDAYGDFYIQSLDLLVGSGGRDQALKHDVAASCIYGKRLHFVDLLNLLSSTGGVPATVTRADGKVVVDNAAAAFGRNISFYSAAQPVVPPSVVGDKWGSVFADVASVATEVCRARMPAEHMFS